MIYLITQILALLVVASIISGIVGWLLRRIKAARAEGLLRQRLRRSERSIPPIKDALAQAHDDLDRQDADLTSLRSELEDRQNLISDAERRQRELQRQLEQNRNAVAQTEADREGLQRDLEALKAVARNTDAANANLDGIIASLNNDLQDKDSQNQQQAAKNAELNDQVNDLMSRLDAGGKDLENLDHALRSEQADHQRAKQAADKAEDRINVLNDQLADRSKERDKLEAMSADQQKELKALQRQIADLEKALGETNNSAAQQVSQLEHKLDKERALAAQTDKQLKNEGIQRSRLQQDLDRAMGDMKNALSANEDKSAKLKDELERQKFAAVEANTARAENERKYADLKRDHDGLKKEHAGAQQRLVSSEVDAAALREKTAALQQQMAGLEKSVQDQSHHDIQAKEKLERELASLQADLQNSAGALQTASGKEAELQQQVGDYQSLEAELRGRIAQLETLLAEQRKLAGRSMLDRILELETMLEAERRKADELPDYTEVNEVKALARVQHANSDSLKEKKSA